MRKLLLLFTLFLLWGINCSKNPVSPGLSRGPFLYALTPQSVDGYARIYYIDTSVDSLVDSLLLPYLDPLGLGVSPHGDRIYLTVRDSSPFDVPYTIEINPYTKQIVYQGQNSGIPTPDGKYLLGFTYPDKGLTVYDARFHTKVFHSDTGFQDIRITFDESRGLVYGAIREPGITMGKIGVFNYRTLRWERVIDLVEAGGFPTLIFDIVVSPKLQKLYLSSPDPFFYVLDLRTDRLVKHVIASSHASLAITKDERYVYLTDPGGYLIPPEPTGYIEIYSTFDEAPVQPSIDTRTLCPLPCAYCPLYTDQIKISPDGSKAYVSNFPGCIMVVIDIPSNSLRKIDLVPGEAWSISQLLIQSKL